MRQLFYLNFSVYQQNLRLFAKFAYFILAIKFFSVRLLNSGVVIYLLWQGTLFLTAVRAVRELVILGVSFLSSFILALIVLLVAKLIMLDILSSIFLLLALYISSLTPSAFTI